MLLRFLQHLPFDTYQKFQQQVVRSIMNNIMKHSHVVKHPLLRAVVLSTLLPLNLFSFAAASSKESDLLDRQLTIYQEGIALVSENRTFELSEETTTLLLPHIAPEAIMESLLLKFNPTQPQDHALLPQIIEKKLNRNLLSPTTLIDYSIGKEVEIIWQTPKERREKAVILSNNGGLLLQYEDRIESGLPADARIAFKELPNGLTRTPALSILLDNLPKTATPYDANLSYLTRGIRWSSDYIAELNEKEKTFHLEGWATINNQSGIDFSNSSLSLIAGNLHLTPQVPLYRENFMVKAASSPQQDSIAPQPVSDYQRFLLPGKFTLQQQEQTQIALFSADQIPYQKRYHFDNMSPSQRLLEQSSPQNATVSFHFDNKKADQLGFALPSGTIRLYQAGEETPIFLGEDYLTNSAAGEKITLNMGSTFDVTLTREQQQYRIVNPDEWEVSYQLTLNNRKAEAVDVALTEYFSPGQGVNWELISQQPPAILKNESAIWNITLPANGEKRINYSVRYTIFQPTEKR